MSTLLAPATANSTRLAAVWTPANILRVGAGLCFIGHGAFGIITKAGWLPYFALVGIPPETAYALMPLVGAVDILVGLCVLFSPRPVALMYMVVWALWTAALRPLTGEPVWEFFERAGNYGVPLALLLLAGWQGGLLGAARPEPSGDRDRRAGRAAVVLRLATAMLLAGHGALALLGKPLLVEHAAVLGLPPSAVALMGGIELIMALAVAARPTAPLLLTILGWKLGTELLFPLAGDYIWEFVERAGSYAAPLALFLLLYARSLHVGAPVFVDDRAAATKTLAGVNGGP